MMDLSHKILVFSDGPGPYFISHGECGYSFNGGMHKATWDRWTKIAEKYSLEVSTYNYGDGIQIEGVIDSLDDVKRVAQDLIPFSVQRDGRIRGPSLLLRLTRPIDVKKYPSAKTYAHFHTINDYAKEFTPGELRALQSKRVSDLLSDSVSRLLL